jgi:hypothetical protein
MVIREPYEGDNLNGISSLENAASVVLVFRDSAFGVTPVPTTKTLTDTCFHHETHQ